MIHFRILFAARCSHLAARMAASGEKRAASGDYAFSGSSPAAFRIARFTAVRAICTL